MSSKYTTLLTVAIGGDFVAIKHPRRCALQQTWLITLSALIALPHYDFPLKGRYSEGQNRSNVL